VQIPCQAPMMMQDPTQPNNPSAQVQSGWCLNYTTLWLSIPLVSRPLTTPQVYWKPAAGVANLMAVQGSTQSGSTVLVPITPNSANSGGFYVVQNQVNAGAVAGIAIGCSVVVLLVFYVYWKVRMQPLGGVSAWLKDKKRLRKEQAVRAADSQFSLVSQREGAVPDAAGAVGHGRTASSMPLTAGARSSMINV